jgi:IS5 family transposase
MSVRVGKGRRHDFHLWKESEVKVAPDVAVVCDSGYQGMQKIHANCQKPDKATKKKPLTKEQKRGNRRISSRRVPVEHTIRRIKVFRILGERYRNRRRRFGLRLNLIAAIINMEL